MNYFEIYRNISINDTNLAIYVRNCVNYKLPIILFCELPRINAIYFDDSPWYECGRYPHPACENLKRKIMGEALKEIFVSEYDEQTMNIREGYCKTEQSCSVADNLAIAISDANDEVSELKNFSEEESNRVRMSDVVSGIKYFIKQFLQL